MWEKNKLKHMSSDEIQSELERKKKNLYRKYLIIWALYTIIPTIAFYFLIDKDYAWMAFIGFNLLALFQFLMALTGLSNYKNIFDGLEGSSDEPSPAYSWDIKQDREEIKEEIKDVLTKANTGEISEKDAIEKAKKIKRKMELQQQDYSGLIIRDD